MTRRGTKILIVGAGVIGSIYAAHLSRAGYPVTMYARSARLAELREKGLLFQNPATKRIDKADVEIVSTLPDDSYDFIFVTVRYEQIEYALTEIKDTRSQSIVTMVNNPLGYESWERIVGQSRIIPAFPGAGGRIEDGVLYYRLTPGFVQPTTFGELSGETTIRLKHLYEMLKSSGFPVRICKDMDAWQKSHLAMVIPMANAIYFDGGDNYTTAQNKTAIHTMSLSLQENFHFLTRSGIPVLPPKLNVLRFCPLWILDLLLKFMYGTRFAETLISNHANNAKHEMILLNRDFAEMARLKGVSLQYLPPDFDPNFRAR